MSGFSLSGWQAPWELSYCYFVFTIRTYALLDEYEFCLFLRGSTTAKEQGITGNAVCPTFLNSFQESSELAFEKTLNMNALQFLQRNDKNLTVSSSLDLRQYFCFPLMGFPLHIQPSLS